MKNHNNGFIEPTFDGRDFNALIVKTSCDWIITIPENYDKVKDLGEVWSTNGTAISVVSGSYWMPIDFGGKEYKILMDFIQAYIDYRYSRQNTFMKLNDLKTETK